MITRLPFVFGAAAMAAVMAAVVIGMTRPSRPPLIPAQKTSAAPIADKWPVKEVRTISITPAITPAVPPKQAVPPTRNYRAPEDGLSPHRYVAPEPRKTAAMGRGDICRGKGKRYTNNGRSWRCKR